MGQYSIYRKFYNFTYTNTGSTHTLINPVFLSANTFFAGSADTQSNTIVEQGLVPIQDQLGVYYVNLDPTKYALDMVYDIVWYVTYTNSVREAPSIHQLTTRFKMNNVQFIDQINVEVINNLLQIEIL